MALELPHVKVSDVHLTKVEFLVSLSSWVMLYAMDFILNFIRQEGLGGFGIEAHGGLGLGFRFKRAGRGIVRL